MVDYLRENEFNFVVALTKADKLSRAQQARQLASIRKQLELPAEQIFLSCLQNRRGIDELEAPYRGAIVWTSKSRPTPAQPCRRTCARHRYLDED